MGDKETSQETIHEGCYVINKQYELTYMDDALKHMQSEYPAHAHCYEVLRKVSQPCSDCPLQDFHENGSSVRRKLYYNHMFECWVECAMMKINAQQEDETTLIHLKKIEDANRNLFLQFAQDVQYDNLLEINLTKNTYERLYNNEELIQIPIGGNLHNLISLIGIDYVHPDEKDIYNDFFNLGTLKDRMQHAGYLLGDFRFLYGDLRYHWTLLYMQKVEKHPGEDTYFCFIANVDEKHTLEKQQKEQANQENYDSLTNLYNQRAFQEQVEQRLVQDTHREYGIINIDIEHFKLFNDWYGTKQGDDLLRYIGKQIHAICAQYDGIAARIGGDDFMMLVPCVICNEAWLEEEIIHWMQNYAPDTKFMPTGGIYILEDRSMPVTLMCDRASLALSSVKGNYAKRVAMYSHHMKQKLQNEQEVLFGVKYGLEHKEFEVYYQPQCSARTNRILGAEALVRWNHPGKGMLPPNEFIPILESSGFISQLDYYVWEEVCAFLHARIQAGKRVVPVSVNVSRIDIFQYHIKEVFLNFIEKYELPVSLLEIEITESAYSENFNQLIQAVEELREAGFTVLMDDFGSGYSSLNMLKDIEIDILKIDMKLLDLNEKSMEKGSGILESIIQMAKWLGLRIIAEGVERKEQVDNLLNLDCEYIQGYYFYRPMPQSEFTALLENEDKVDTRGLLAKRLPSIQLDDLFHKDITSEAMLSNILGGIAIYEVSDDGQLEIKMVNDKYYRMTHCNPVDLCERGKMIIKQVYPEDLSIIWDIFDRAEKSSALGASGTFRRYRLSGELMWMHLHAFYLRKQGNKKVFYGSVTDYSENMDLQKKIMTLLDTMPGNILEFRVKDGVLIDKQIISAGLAENFGYPKEQYQQYLGDERGWAFLHEEDLGRIQSIIQHPETWGREISFECRAKAQDGHTIWIEQHIRLVDQEEGALIYNSLCTDITKIKMQEEELRESQGVLENLLGIRLAEQSTSFMAQENRKQALSLLRDAMNGGMMGCYCEASYPLYFANKEFLAMLGYQSYEELYEQIDGKIENLIYVDDRERIYQDVWNGLCEGLEYTNRFRMQKKDGQYIWVLEKGKVVKIEDRLTFISNINDVSETVNAKRRLAEAQEDIELLNTMIPSGYYQSYCTENFEFKHVSERFLAITGYTRQELKERFHNRYIEMVHPLDRKKVQEANQLLYHEKAIYDEQYRIIGAKGILWISEQSRIVYHDKECYFAGIIKDVSQEIALQEHLAMIVENTPGDVFSFIHNEITYHSHNLAKTLGFSMEEYKAMADRYRGRLQIDERDLPAFKESVRMAREHRSDIDLMFRCYTKHKDIRYIHMKASCASAEDEEPSYYGILIDATLTRQREQQLHISQQSFTSIIHQAKLNIWQYDVRSGCLSLNHNGLLQICDQVPACAVVYDTNCRIMNFLLQLEHKEQFQPAAFHVLSIIKEFILQECFHERIIDLSSFFTSISWLKITCEGIYNEEGELVKVIGYFQDVSEQIEKEVLTKEEKRYAQFDALTGVYNRRMGEILIENALQKCSDHIGAVMMIDLDNFKQVNDCYGHVKGDEVLHSVARAIRYTLDEQDYFCRFGGDEFLYFAHCASKDEVAHKAQEIMDCIPIKDMELPKEMQISLSIGIACAPGYGTDLKQLYEKADTALYEAKAKGKCRYQFYEAS